ncbi:MAG: glycoside hydrolase family 38 C-terminal domain-containing protein [Verrucomicrobiota bacterium]|nr:glycoside hydrolase family 38 C-terminal domain-containing protein [Verrucomicrobiota bacterium]
MKSCLLPFLLTLLTTASAALSGAVQSPTSGHDPANERVLYQIGYAHLDTQWRWDYRQVISEFLPNTVKENETLFEKYPNYVFNFSGANRYRMIKEYHPADFAKIQRWVSEGRWFPAGSSWEETDVNVPSSESLIRNILYGNQFFKRELGVTSTEFMLPDCFGFPASLPSILAHSGVRGFSTQKLTWRAANPIPFHVGFWEGPDGQGVIAALEAGNYITKVESNRAWDWQWASRITRYGTTLGLNVGYDYYGVGDRGGAPDERSVKFVQEAMATKDGFQTVVSGRADQMFNDITDAQRAKLQRYHGDLLLIEHSAGSITSGTAMKQWNRLNEQLADAAERAAVAAHLLGAATYPRQKLTDAWGLVIGAQFHDILPGTSLPKAYEFSWNDEVLAMNSFAEVLTHSVAGVARSLDTTAPTVDAIPLVVYNPLTTEHEGVVEATLAFNTVPTAIEVVDGAGAVVPSQLLSVTGQSAQFIFLARTPSVGFAVYSVRAIKEARVSSSSLTVTERSLENSRYRVSLNDNGDIASIFDKLNNREILSAPSRLVFQYECPMEYPAWNMDWNDRSKQPSAVLKAPATFRIVEQGAVRVAIQVERAARNSVFSQTIRLSVGAAGDRVEVVNDIAWQTSESSLRAEFPLTVKHPLATYNMDFGKVRRGNNEEKKFEVPTHQWFDLTDSKGDYGVSILTDAKYGSDKPSDSLVRLTLLYTPGVRWDSKEQRYQDWGRHHFVYGISGHARGWMDGQSDRQASEMSQPLYVFRTSAHKGILGRQFSLLTVDDPRVAVRAIKLAEDSDSVVVRLQELAGNEKVTTKLQFLSKLLEAEEINGVESPLGRKLQTTDKQVSLDFTPFQMRSLAIKTDLLSKHETPRNQSLTLPYNVSVIAPQGRKSTSGFDNQGHTIAAEMIGETVVSEEVPFQIGTSEAEKFNAVQCEGQTLALPAGHYNSLYLLAASTGGDTDAEFTIDGTATKLRIQDWNGYIGQWDNRVFKGDVLTLTYSVDNELDRLDAGYIKRAPVAWYSSHRHKADGTDDIYAYSYLFKYRIPLADGARTLVLPKMPNIRILAITAALDEVGDTTPVRPLYDDYTGRTPLTLIK